MWFHLRHVSDLSLLQSVQISDGSATAPLFSSYCGLLPRFVKLTISI
jgi:hypothetical protein